jgi:hypothetical protein
MSLIFNFLDNNIKVFLKFSILWYQKNGYFSHKREILVQTHLSKNFPNFFSLRNIIFFLPKKNTEQDFVI